MNVYKNSSNLDLLRSIAVIFVVASHLPFFNSLSSQLFGLGFFQIQALGLFGVGIFFVHTCFVLMLSLKRHSLEEGATHQTLKFFIRRAFRIYPLSMAAVVIMALVDLYFKSNKIDASQVISNIFLIQNIFDERSNPGVLWSLPLEVQMYIFLPSLFFVVGRANEWAIGLTICLWTVSVFFVLGLWKAGLNYHLVKYFPAFLPGVMAYAIKMKAQPFLKSQILFLYVAVVAAIFPFLVAHGVKKNILLWPVCFGLGVLIPLCHEIESVFLKKFSASIAKYSFGIYIVHGPLVEVSFEFLPSYFIGFQWLVFMTSTIFLSILAYKLIEKPMVAKGEEIIKRKISVKGAFT